MNKQIIISDFFKDEEKVNFALYQMTYQKLETMLDKALEVIESGKNWMEFLKAEGAVNAKGYPKQDLRVSYHDKESKQNVTDNVVMKYAVYMWLKKKIQAQQNKIMFAQEVSWAELLEGKTGNITGTKELELIAKGLKRYILSERSFGRSPGQAESMLRMMWVKYNKLKQPEGKGGKA